MTFGYSHKKEIAVQMGKKYPHLVYPCQGHSENFFSVPENTRLSQLMYIIILNTSYDNRSMNENKSG